jgi:peptidoglycan/LPS O-acetylase OafA/YrhL
MALAMKFDECRRAVAALPQWLLASACVACVTLLSDWNEWAAGLGALGAVLIAAASPLAHRALAIAPLAWLGRISYSLYLVHLPALLAIGHILSGRAPVGAILVAAFTAALVLAQAVRACVEGPSIFLSTQLPAIRLSKLFHPYRRIKPPVESNLH